MIIFQVSRAAVEGYNGMGDPPCLVMKLRADSSKTTPPKLSLPVTLTGVREQNCALIIERLTEGNVIFSKMYPDLTLKKQESLLYAKQSLQSSVDFLQGFYKAFTRL